MMVHKRCLSLLLAGLLLASAACTGQEAAPSSSGTGGTASTVSGESAPETAASSSDGTAPTAESTASAASAAVPPPAGVSEKTASTASRGSSHSTTRRNTPVATSSTSPSVTVAATPSAAEKNYKKYNIGTWIQPIWAGDTVYNETVMFVPNAQTKEIEPAPLLYTPDKILSVRSFDLTKEYKEGVDYVVENGRIKLTDRTRIPVWKYDDYYCKSVSQFDLPSISAPGRHLKYGAGATFQKTQVCVSYTHKGSWTGPVPAYQGGKLPKTIQMLSQKKPVSIVYNGDSITVGAESSKWNNIAPFAPIWSQMVTEEIKAVYGGPITETNTAVGGMDSKWGLENVQENINKYNPDLVFLGFGMNDGTQGVKPAQFQSNIEETIKAVRAKHPNCEFVLVSTTLPNPDVSGPWTQYQPEYQAVLETIASRMSGVAVAKMTDMHQFLLTKKRYWDMTGNNINHPNDFLARVYAQVAAQALIQHIQ